jgi:hypothetical protein
MQMGDYLREADGRIIFTESVGYPHDWHSISF